MFDCRYQTTTLGNGLVVGSAYLPNAQSAAIGIWCRAGSRHERAAENGVAHFVEHMVFKGTKRRSARRISMDIEGVGGELNALTAEDHTCYHVWLPSRWFARGLRVLADMYCHAELKERAFDNEREVIFEEIEMYRENPGQHVEDLLSCALWRKHALARPITGTEKTLMAMSPESLRKWIAERHVGTNTLVAVAGPVPHHEVVKQAESLLGQLPVGRRAAASKVKSLDEAWDAQAWQTEERDLGQIHAGLGFRGPSRSDEKRYAFKLLNVVLGETMGSRLFQALRERRAACYHVQSGVEVFGDAGVLDIFTGLDRSKGESALALLFDELKKLRSSVISAAELNDAREYVLGSQQLWFESVSNQMSWVGDSLLAGSEIADPAESQRRVKQVTAAEIRSLAREVFQKSRMGGAAVGSDLATVNVGGLLD